MKDLLVVLTVVFGFALGAILALGLIAIGLTVLANAVGAS